MARLSNDSLDAIAKSWDALEIQRDCARLYDHYRRADRIMSARFNGWSHRTAMEERGGEREGAIQAYTDQAKPQILSNPFPPARPDHVDRR
jgi:hypothetical protein